MFHFRNRLQELEIESEQLDKSFHKYLKKQNEEKQILADDINKVWQQYERAKDNMIKTFVVPERRTVVPTNIHFHENIIPVPVSVTTTDDPVAPVVVERSTNQFENPYKILRANLALTGSLDTSKSKKEIEIQANVPSLTVHQTADKVSQIPMKIKSIMKKPMDNEPKIHLRISTSSVNDQPLSEPSDASSYMNLKNVSSSAEVAHLSDSKPSDSSIKSKHSEISMKSPQSKRSEGSRNENHSIHKSNVEPVGATNGSTVVQTGTLAKQRNVDTEEMFSLFKKIEIKNQSTHSTSSESSEKRNISTGHKSTSSDDFWK